MCILKMVSSTRNKPWNVDKEQVRIEKIDRMATQIATEEAMKNISEAYEVVFEGEGSKNQLEKENNGEIEEGRKEDTTHKEKDSMHCVLTEHKNMIAVGEAVNIGESKEEANAIKNWEEYFGTADLHETAVSCEKSTDKSTEGVDGSELSQWRKEKYDSDN